MKMVAASPRARAAYASDWPLLPALAVTTPVTSGSRVEILLRAPRSLNEPVRCRFSALSAIAPPPVVRERKRDSITWVRRTTSAITSRAASMSASATVSVTAVISGGTRGQRNGGVHLDQGALGQRRDAHGRADREGLLEEGRVHVVHPGELRHVRQIDPDPRRIREAGARGPGGPPRGPPATAPPPPRAPP